MHVISSLIFSGYEQNCFYFRNIKFLKCWGSNYFGESETHFLVMNQYIRILSIGRMYVCAIVHPQLQDSNGLLICWGNEESDQSRVPEAFQTQVSHVEAGDYHTCAITHHNEFGCWGSNSHGQCNVKSVDIFGNEDVKVLNFQVKGNVTLILDTTKITILGDSPFLNENYYLSSIDKPNRLKKIKTENVVLGENHFCIYLDSLECYGDNEDNQITTPKLEEVFLLRSYSNHTCAISSTSTGPMNNLNCWGNNSKNQLEVPSAIGSYSLISTGSEHTCVVQGYSYVACYGSNKHNLAQLPKDVSNFVTHSGAGGEFTCVLVGGYIKCIGKNNKEKLFKIPPEFKYGQISSGFNHICGTAYNVFLSIELVHCWGIKDQAIIEVPPHINTDFYQVRKLESGFKFSCVVKSTVAAMPKPNTLLCWGLNDHGQTDIPEDDNAHDWQFLRLGIAHVCITNASLELSCWGVNTHGQTAIPAGYTTLVQFLTAGYYHSCAILLQGRGECWGLNTSGQTDIPRETASYMTHVSGGGNFTCGMDRYRTIKCWGGNKFHQLKVPSLGKVAYLTLGQRHTCAMMYNGTIKCWGDDTYDQTRMDKLMVK